MGELKHREDILYTFEKLIENTEDEILRFYAGICEIENASESYRIYHLDCISVKNYDFSTRSYKEPEYKNLEQFVEAHNLLKTNLSDISYLSFFSYLQKRFFVYHKNAISKKYREFISAIEASNTDVNSLNYKAIDIYKLFGAFVMDKQLPIEEVQLRIVPQFSIRALRVYYRENEVEIKLCLLILFLAVIAFIVVLKDSALKILAAGFLAVAYFILSYVLVNLIFGKLINKDESGKVGCISTLILSVIPAVLIFIAGINYNETDSPTSSEINGFDSDYNPSLTDDYLNDYDKVYITTSEDGECYHINENCISLSRSIDIEQVTKSEALSMGLTPCHNCTAR